MIHKNFMVDTLSELISWFWTDYKSHKDGICQCDTERFIQSSSDPNLMRVFLTFGVFVDQHRYTHVPTVYNNFRAQFRLPKLYFCPSGFTRMASPSWFIYELKGTEIDWTLAEDVGRAIFQTVRQWLQDEDANFLVEFDSSLKSETKIEFRSNVEKVWNIVKP
jgi:hypothetical protein